MMVTPIEGFFLITDEGLIFEVKGNLHPESQYIAYLRYVVDPNGDRLGKDGHTYRKIYPLRDRETFLQKNYPHYLRFDARSNRVLQVVPMEKIAFLLDPIDSINQMKDSGPHLNELQISTLELVGSLIDHCGISSDSIGITGSQLVGLTTENSDIDLVIYGERAGKQLYNSLAHERPNIPRLEQYRGTYLHRHTEFRWGSENKNFETLCLIESKKRLQGLFNGFDFFIRLVKTPKDLAFGYYDLTYERIGTRVLTCQIIDDSQSMFTPCEYKAVNQKIPDQLNLVSFRGRYTEHAKTGMAVDARGVLEKVTHRNGKSWLQLVMGEEITDFLLPISDDDKLT